MAFRLAMRWRGGLSYPSQQAALVDELVRTTSVYGEPRRLIGMYPSAQVKVFEPSVFLGPSNNPIGSAFFDCAMLSHGRKQEKGDL
jgi:hypothetical protein